MDNINVNDESSKIKFSFHKNYNGIFLNDDEVNILKLYGFDVNKYNNIKELMFDIEDYLLNNEDDVLEGVLSSLAEFNYYNNTDK